jgi:hypothetical protein
MQCRGSDSASLPGFSLDGEPRYWDALCSFFLLLSPWVHATRHHADSWIMPRTRRWKAVRRGLAAISLLLESA